MATVQDTSAPAATLDRVLIEQRISEVRTTIQRANALIACAIAAADTECDYADEISETLVVAHKMLQHVCGTDLDQVVLYAPAKAQEVAHVVRLAVDNTRPQERQP